MNPVAASGVEKVTKAFVIRAFGRFLSLKTFPQKGSYYIRHIRFMF
jgi:hypothetical protein